MTWTCSCGLINSGLNDRCAALRKITNEKHEQVTPNSPDYLMYVVASQSMSILTEKEKQRLAKVKQDLQNGDNPYSNVGTIYVGMIPGERRSADLASGKTKETEPEETKPEYQIPTTIRKMTTHQELFQKSYSTGKILVKDMDDETLHNHRLELEDIKVETNAHIMAAVDEIKERRQKLSPQTRANLTTIEEEQITSDAINVVKIRKARMSKMDKIKEQLMMSIKDEKIVNEMMLKMEKRATEQDLKVVNFKPLKIEPPVNVEPIKSNDSKPVVSETKASDNGKKDDNPFNIIFRR